MKYLIDNKNKIFSLKNKLDNLDSSLFNHYIVNNYEITNEATTVIMTSSNRSRQTYFTLKSMLNSKCKNIQIILVDDSNTDPIDINILKNFPYYIDFIVINKENKDWINPAVNYNIGFKFIKGNNVVIQNAEVCHIGDPLDFININMEDNKYYVFDVHAIKCMENNEVIYESDLTNIDIYNKPIYTFWYQHHKYRNYNWHFLTAMKKNTFNKIKEFSYDYSYGTAYDDNDFLLKIISNNIDIINVENEKYNLGGIHLYHKNFNECLGKKVYSNKEIYNNKKKYYEMNKIYFDITEDEDKFDDKYNLLKKINEIQ